MWLHPIINDIIDWSHNVVWQSLTFFQPTPTPDNIARCGKQWLVIRNTWSNHVSWLRFTTSSIDLTYLPSTITLTSWFPTHWSQNTRAILLRHLWSNTGNLRISSTLDDHVLPSYGITEFTYTFIILVTVTYNIWQKRHVDLLKLIFISVQYLYMGMCMLFQVIYTFHSKYVYVKL